MSLRNFSFGFSSLKGFLAWSWKTSIRQGPGDFKGRRKIVACTWVSSTTVHSYAFEI